MVNKVRHVALGIVSPGEECDSGENGVFGGGDSVDCNSAAAGMNACKVRFCGDGYTNAVSGEVCEPGVPTDCQTENQRWVRGRPDFGVHLWQILRRCRRV